MGKSYSFIERVPTGCFSSEAERGIHLGSEVVFINCEYRLKNGICEASDEDKICRYSGMSSYELKQKFFTKKKTSDVSSLF